MKNLSLILLISILTIKPLYSSNSSATPTESPMIELKQIIPSNPFVIPAEEVNRIIQVTGLQIEELLVHLISIAKSFARPPISNYWVGEAALGKSGNIYLGVNIEFLNLPLNAAIHGEQFLIANARNNGESEILLMALPAAPCGHCRQFLNDIDETGQLKILIPNLPPKSLSSLLPDAFGPKNLGLKACLLDLPKQIPSFSNEPLLIAKAMQAAYSSYAPYSRSKSGVAIQTIDGKIYTGSYLENAAFNPSLSPLQAAIVSLVADLRNYEEISEVVLVEQLEAPVSQEMSTRALLSCIAPTAYFRLEKRDFRLHSD